MWNNYNYTHTRCKQSQHASSGLMIRGWLAWGSTNAPGRSGKRSRKDLPETVLCRRGLFTGKGKPVIFTMWKHYENDTNGKSSTNRECERWNHLNRSYGCLDTKVEDQGPIDEFFSAQYINVSLPNSTYQRRFTPRQRCQKRVFMTHKYRGSIVVLSISKSVEPNEEQKALINSFQQGNNCKHWK